MSQLRCFVGVRPPEQLNDDLVDCMAELKADDPNWRGQKWVAAHNLHLTLHFLGDVESRALDGIVEALGRSLSDTSAFELPFSRVEAAPRTSRARTLWARFDDPHGACEALALTVREAIGDAPSADKVRPFKAHMTLCRARAPLAIGTEALASATALLEARGASMSVRCATLFSSRLTPRGPVYEAIEQWWLRGD